MRISDWSSDVCSSDLRPVAERGVERHAVQLDVLRILDLQLGRIKADHVTARAFRIVRIEQRMQQRHVSAGREELHGAGGVLGAGFYGRVEAHVRGACVVILEIETQLRAAAKILRDRKSTRLNYSHNCTSRLTSSARKQKKQ